MILMVLGGDTAFVVSDNFNRANSSDLGANWTELGDGNLVISASALSVANGVGTSARRCFFNTALPSPNHFIAVNSATSTTAFHLYLRCDDETTPTAGYAVDYSPASSGTVRIRRGDPIGTLTTLDTATGVGGNISGQTFRAEANGSTIRALINGVEVLSVNDGSPVTSGSYVGIRMDTADHRVDDFVAGTL